MKILSADQIRKWDEYTIANEPIASINLMERAALACTNWIVDKFDTTNAIKIFCGKGNNGGDGLAIARQLIERKYNVDIYILEFGTIGTIDFQTNLTRLHLLTAAIHFIQHVDFFPKMLKEDVVVDALFGSGINRSLEGLTFDLVKHINASQSTIVSIDLPSGLFTELPSKGKIIKATHTLTFQCLKLCFLYPENEQYFGTATVLNIGLHNDYLQNIESKYCIAEHEEICKLYKPRKKFTHKGTYGHTLMIAGEKGKMGAAILASKACLRTGSGLVTSMVPDDQFSIIQTAVPEAMSVSHEMIETIDLSVYNTIGIGPGLGSGSNGARLIQEVLWNYNKPIVIDADGLNLLAANQDFYKEIPPGSILTPHPKEFERLFGKTANHPATIKMASKQAKKYFIYIIVKGHNSFVACPDGDIHFNSTGNPGMATAGSGDVLTGILTGLLAQGYSSKEACLLGLYIHGLAGDLAAKSLTEESLISSDIIQFLGMAYKSLFLIIH